MLNEPALHIRESWHLEMLGTHLCGCCLGLRLSWGEGGGSLGSNPWAQVPSPCPTVRLLRGDREGWEPGWSG